MAAPMDITAIRRFIADCSTISQPLDESTKKGNTTREDAFDKPKKQLAISQATDPILIFSETTFFLQTNAGNVGFAVEYFFLLYRIQKMRRTWKVTI